MKFENLKIGTLLKTGFAILLLFVVAIGFISYQQSSEMHQQTEDMYNHPLQVRRSIGELTANVHAIRVDMKNLFLTSDKEEQEKQRVDRYCNKMFSYNFYKSFFNGITDIYKRKNINKIQLHVPMLMFSGSKDSLCKNGMLVKKLRLYYKENGVNKVFVKL